MTTIEETIERLRELDRAASPAPHNHHARRSTRLTRPPQYQGLREEA